MQKNDEQQKKFDDLVKEVNEIKKLVKFEEFV